jgi:hypothetical protein
MSGFGTTSLRSLEATWLVAKRRHAHQAVDEFLLLWRVLKGRWRLVPAGSKNRDAFAI